MDWIALAARLLLALVFTVAAAGKLADQGGTRSTLSEFGMPTRSLATLALLLPLAELATAVALVVQQSGRWGAVAALGLLLLFAAGITSAMLRGEAPDCNCFGQLGSAPAGPGTLVRNALLAAPAILVVAHGPGKALDSSLASGSAAVFVAIGAGLAAVALAVISARFASENRELRGALERLRAASAVFPPGLPIGAKAPGFELPAISGETVTLESLLVRGKPIAMVFLSADCGPCALMFPNLARWQKTLSDRLTIVMPTRGSITDISALAEEHGLDNVLADEKGVVFESFRGSATPSVVIVTAAGRIGSRTRATLVVVESLIREALHNEAMFETSTARPANGESALRVIPPSRAAHSPSD